MISTRLLTLALLPLLSPSLFADNASVIRSPLTNTGADPDAVGRVVATLSGKSSVFAITVAKLAPGAAHTVEVGGIVEGTFTTKSNGSATVSFRTPKQSGSLLLDFDPRGKQVRVLAGGVSVLQATISGAGEPSGADVTERVNLTPAAGATGKARADFRLDKSGKRVFKVELERAGAGPFELFVAGISRGTFSPIGIIAKIRFASSSDDPGVLPLDFDPRGQSLEVRRNGVILFSGTLAALARGVNFASPRLSIVRIPSTGADPDGSAEAKLRIDERARKHFDVEIEDVPVGTYDLLVNGVDVGNIVVTSVTGGTKGEVEFTSGDDDPGELPLTFDPVGKTLTVQQGATVFFQGTFNPDTDSGAGTPGFESPSELEESLTSTGLDGDASGRARYRVDSTGRHRFDVEIEDVPVGNYALRVAGAVRGTIRVLSSASGIEGEIEFSTRQDPGELPLTFDPRGQLIEVLSPAGIFFSHLLGAGSN
jgi:hypothetical protein